MKFDFEISKCSFFVFCFCCFDFCFGIVEQLWRPYPNGEWDVLGIVRSEKWAHQCIHRHDDTEVVRTQEFGDATAFYVGIGRFMLGTWLRNR